MPPAPNPIVAAEISAGTRDVLIELPKAAAAMTKAVADSRNLTGTLLPNTAKNMPLNIWEKANVLAVSAAEGPGKPWSM